MEQAAGEEAAAAELDGEEAAMELNGEKAAGERVRREVVAVSRSSGLS